MGTKTVSKKAAALDEVASPADVPAFATDDEAAAYWETHAPGPQFFDSAVVLKEDGLPPPRPRTSPVSIRFDADAMARLKALAKKKHKGYQTLLKEFVLERLYEEEKREGLVGR